MLQRIQTIYWLLNVFLMLGAYFLFPWNISLVGLPLPASDTIQIFVAITSILHVFNIFLYKKRTSQMRITMLLLVLHVLFYGFSIYHWLVNGAQNEDFGWGIVLGLTILLLGLAHKAVVKDEQLVRSVDRIR